MGGSVLWAARIVARALGCGKAAAAVLVLVPLTALAMEKGELTIQTRQGPLTYFVEIARTPAERSQGLMFRDKLPKDHGMLFDFGREQAVSFWMKNTPLSLDLLFVDGKGEIVHIADRAVPYSEDLIPSTRPVRWVLEIIGGSANDRGIRTGDKLDGLPPGPS